MFCSRASQPKDPTEDLCASVQRPNMLTSGLLKRTTANVFVGGWSLFELGSVTLDESHDVDFASDVVELFFAETGHDFGLLEGLR